MGWLIQVSCGGKDSERKRYILKFCHKFGRTFMLNRSQKKLKGCQKNTSTYFTKGNYFRLVVLSIQKLNLPASRKRRTRDTPYT